MLFRSTTYLPPKTGWEDPPGYPAPADIAYSQPLPADAFLLSEQKSGRSVRARSFYDEREKNWNVQFLVRSIDNENDYIFSFRSTSKQIQSNFFKLNMPTSDIPTFLSDYYFNSAGDYYLSSDGVNYTEKNGSVASGTLPADTYNLQAIESGRAVNISVSPDDEMDTVSIRAEITWGSDVDESGTRFYSDDQKIGRAHV